jgi:hypothetical protein
MKINKNEILAALKSDLKASEVLKKDMDAKIAQWKREHNGEPYGNEVKGKSSIVSRDIKKQSEWQHASIIDPFVSSSDVIKCHPITFEDAQAARQNELLLNTQFCRKFNRYNFMSKAVKVLDREGTVVVQTGWDYEDEEVATIAEVVAVNEYGQEIIVEQEVTETIVKKNQPTAKICRNEDIYIDPTCQDNLDEAQFIIYRYETNLSTLRKDGRYKNLEKLVNTGGTNNDHDYINPDKTYFEFKDDPRKKLLVYEYWGNYDVDGDGIAEPIVCAWCNDVIIRLGSNPYPDKKPPFIVVPFNSVPFKIHGESNAELIGDNQKVKTAVWRGIIDNMAQSNNGQVAMRKGALDAINKKRFLKGENFEYNGTPNDFWQGSYNAIPGSAFDMLGMMNNEIESLTGVKSFSGGITGAALGSTATSARGAMDAAATRRMNVVRNIAENLVKPLMRKWMAYNSEFLEEEEVIRVTNSEYVPVRRDDLTGRIDIDISISTMEDNSAKSQELEFLLQTLGPSLPFELTQQLMADVLELMRMPDKAEALRKFQPPKDPMEEQLKQLEMERLMLENEKIKSEIQRNLANAGEDEADKRIKLAKAAKEEAYARKLHSESDMKDLEFLSKDEEIDHKHKMELENFKRLANLDSLAFQAMHGGPNEQLGVKHR